MKKFLANLLIVLFVLSAVGMARPRGKFSHKPGKDNHYKHGFHNPIMSELELTDEQEEAIQKIHFNYKKKMISTRSDLKVARMDLREAFHGNKSKNEIQKAADKVKEEQNELFDVRIEKKLKVRQELTNEQKDKLEDLPHFFMKNRSDCSKGDFNCKKDNFHRKTRRFHR